MPADVFRALSDPIRLAMLERLRRGELPAGEIGAGLPVSQPGASQHLKVLRESGLVQVRREGRRRLYALAPERFREVHDWVAHYRAFWEDRLDALEAALDAEEEG